MNRFLDRLSGDFSKNGRLIKLKSQLRYVTSINPATYGYSCDLPVHSSGGWIITAHEGFVSDFVSSPRWSWSVVPPIGDAAWAGVIHDLIYTFHVAGRPWGDKVFLEAMDDCDTSAFVKYASYWFLRIGGRSAYDDRSSFKFE